MKTYILYHSNCPDGTGAALAAYLKFGEGAEYIPVNYSQQPPVMIDGSRVFILDFSYPRETLLELKRLNQNLKVIDHHKTAEADLQGLDFCTFDMTKSGAVLAWEYFHPDKPVPLFFLYLQDRDLWQFKLSQSREVSAAIGSFPFDFRIWEKWLSHPDIIFDLSVDGIACLRLKNQQVDIMAKNHLWACFDTNLDRITFDSQAGISRPNEGWYWAPVANATVFFSEVGERLLELNPTAQFAGYYFDRKDGARQWGLRSRKDFDCSVIAKHFGGGGHAQASGFTEKLP